MPGKAKKSAWHLALFPFVFLFGAVAWWIMAQPVFFLRKMDMPPDIFLSGGSTLGLVLFYVGLGFPAMGFGLLGSNILAWSIPPVRAFFDREAQRSGGAPFAQACRSLLGFTLVLLVVCYPAAIAGGMTYYSLSPSGVAYRGWFALKPDIYAWDKVKDIETQCYQYRSSIKAQFTLVFDDGKSIDLFADTAYAFVDAYPELSPHLKGVPFHHQPPGLTSLSTFSAGDCPKSWKRYFEQAP